ncbi:type II toxin-antitoxin system ParD family antitoxin [Marinobacter sp. SS21]|nr:type II toxin-antitoxin system ParD family antitoxin [Marinobacter sp. SS21]MDC0661376.1 type II toxin-antitoxin system ParD family antitoxin [Marinobacter sp. SS21]
MTNHQSEVVDRLVESGRYQNASEVLRTGLRMVEEAESAYLTKMNELRDAIELGQRDVKSGKTRKFTGDEFASYLSERAHLKALKKPDA